MPIRPTHESFGTARQNLRQAGRKEEAEHWLRKLVNDPGKDSWEWRRVRERAQWELERQ